MAIIGYPSNPTTETALERHLIGQRRLLPDPGHIFTGCARFWLFNSPRVPGARKGENDCNASLYLNTQTDGRSLSVLFYRYTDRTHDQLLRKEEWPKSGISDGYVAIIGYPSNPTTETAPGRHIIGQRRPLPDPGHIFTGCA